MSSSLAADAAPFDFCFPPATPPPAASASAFAYDPSALLDIPYANYFAPAVGYPSHGSAHGHGHGHTRSSSQCSAISAYSFASSGPSAPSDAFVSNPNSRQGTPAPATTTTPAATATSRRTRSPIRTHGPLLLPKIRSQDQALGTDAHVRALSPPKRARTAVASSLAPATPGASRSRSASAHGRRRNSSLLSPYAAATAASSRHVRSATNPDNALFYASMAGSTPPPPALLCEPVHFAQQPLPHPHQNQHQHQPEDEPAKDGGHDDYDYGFAPYPGTVPTSYMLSSSADLSALSDAGLMVDDGAYLYQQQQQQTLYHPHLAAATVVRGSSPLSVASSSSSSPPPALQSVSVSGTPEPPSLAVSVPVASPHAVPVITETPPSATTQTAPAMSAVTPTTTLLAHLTGPNPAPALVRTISFPLRDPNTKHYWWDVRQVQPWTAFTAAGLAALPGATDVLSCPVPAALLALPATAAAAHQRPETEADLHALCAENYLPRVNAALALSSGRPVQLTSSTSSSGSGSPLFLGHAAGDSAPAAALFGGRPTARVVGLVKSFDRFNTGMRAEGNVKRVEYLRGLAHLHHVMREHSCRYGFLLTEIELVVVRNGTEATPQFGQLEVASVALATTAAGGNQGTDGSPAAAALTACLALWGLCMLASDEMAAAAKAAAAAPASLSSSLLCHYHTHIGAPAEGTRHKAAARDPWMPQPQLAEKRTAKRARGWVMPEDAVGRKEMGRRGVRYGGW